MNQASRSEFDTAPGQPLMDLLARPFGDLAAHHIHLFERREASQLSNPGIGHGGVIQDEIGEVGHSVQAVQTGVGDPRPAQSEDREFRYVAEVWNRVVGDRGAVEVQQSQLRGGRQMSQGRRL